MKIFKKIITGGFMILNIGFLILFILSSFSDRVSPNSSILFPFLGIAFPLFLCVNVLFFFYWLITARWIKFLICLGTFVLCFGAIHTYFPVNIPTKHIPEKCIKILSYNVMQFEYKKAHHPDDPNSVVQYMVDSNADIVCIQEYGTGKKDFSLTKISLEKALSIYPYQRIHQLSSEDKNESYGLAIYSKFPILSFREINLDSHYNGAFVAELDIQGKRTSVYNIHLESNKLAIDERKGLESLLDAFDFWKMDYLTDKIPRRLSPAYRLRAKQADLIAKDIQSNPNTYLIVCGDFNDTPISYSRRTIKGKLKDAFVRSGLGLGITYNRYHFYFRIDYILYSKNIKAYNCKVDRTIKNSDHYPISTFLEFK